MDLQLHGKRALVTGSTLGIGFAAALGLAREGAQVVINGRTRARVDQAADQIRAQVPGAIVTAVAADLSGAAGCAALIRDLPDLDVLVNSLGIFEPKSFGEISDADWLRFFETNVMSGVRLARHYLPGMRGRDWGRIIFVSSESAVQIPAEMIHCGRLRDQRCGPAGGRRRGARDSLSPGGTRDCPDSWAGGVDASFRCPLCNANRRMALSVWLTDGSRPRAAGRPVALNDRITERAAILRSYRPRRRGLMDA